MKLHSGKAMRPRTSSWSTRVTVSRILRLRLMTWSGNAKISAVGWRAGRGFAEPTVSLLSRLHSHPPTPSPFLHPSSRHHTPCWPWPAACPWRRAPCAARQVLLSVCAQAQGRGVDTDINWPCCPSFSSSSRPAPTALELAGELLGLVLLRLHGHHALLAGCRRGGGGRGDEQTGTTCEASPRRTCIRANSSMEIDMAAAPCYHAAQATASIHSSRKARTAGSARDQDGREFAGPGPSPHCGLHSLQKKAPQAPFFSALSTPPPYRLLRVS